MKRDKANGQELEPAATAINSLRAGPSSLGRPDANPNSANESSRWWTNVIARIKNGETFISPWMYWSVIFLIVQQTLFAAQKADPALIPNTFSAESTPAVAISHLAWFV